MNFKTTISLLTLLAAATTARAGGGGEPDYPLRSTYSCLSHDGEVRLNLKFLGDKDEAYGRADSIGGNLHKQLGFTQYYVEPIGESSEAYLSYAVKVDERHQAKVDLIISLQRTYEDVYQGTVVGVWDGESIRKPLLCQLSTN